MKNIVNLQISLQNAGLHLKQILLILTMLVVSVGPKRFDSGRKYIAILSRVRCNNANANSWKNRRCKYNNHIL